MIRDIQDCSGRHLIAGRGACAQRVLAVSTEQGIEVDRLDPAALRSVDPAPNGQWWVSLRDGERRLYAGVIVATADCSFVAPEVTGSKESSSHMAAGLVPIGYANIYFLRPPEAQPASELIERGARLVGELVRTQDGLDYPAGALLQRLGLRAPLPWWEHSFVARSEKLVSCWVVQRLPSLQKLIMRGDPRTARIRAVAALLREAGPGRSRGSASWDSPVDGDPEGSERLPAEVPLPKARA